MDFNWAFLFHISGFIEVQSEFDNLVIISVPHKDLILDESVEKSQTNIGFYGEQ